MKGYIHDLRLNLERVDAKRKGSEKEALRTGFKIKSICAFQTIKTK